MKSSSLLLALFLSTVACAQLPLTPCTINKASGLCATYSVPEDRAHPKGRHVALRVFVVPASTQQKKADPLFLIEGGPGISVVENLSNLADFFQSIARDRDIVAVEERGTGQSNPLRCPSSSAPRNIQDALADFKTIARGCLPWARTQAALGQYHSLNAISDLDEVRRALGAEKINLWGLSHGTREALLYIKHYPQHVRAAVLEAPLAPQQHLPAGMAVREDEVLALLFAECAADLECATQHPHLKEDYARALAAFAQGDVQVRMLDPYSKRETTVAYSKGRFGETVRNLLYTVPSANQIPALLRGAAAGDWAPLVLLAASQRIDGDGFPFAMWMSYVCAEDLPYIDASRERALTKNTLLGDYRLAQQKAACSVWPAAHLPRGWDAPVKSDVPVLMMVGELDSVTWSARAREIAARLPNSKLVEVPHGGHLLIGQPGLDECVKQIEGDFLDRGSAVALDTTCAATLSRGPWR
jgi:pimeloyl-ACP methyl ester carboxylesterase